MTQLRYVCVNNSANHHWWKKGKTYLEIDGVLEREPGYGRSMYPVSKWNTVGGLRFIHAFTVYLKEIDQ